MSRRIRRDIPRVLLTGAVLLSGLALAPVRAQAATITVTNNGDSGAGSLRQAIADAGAGDTIDFDASLSGQTISLSTIGDGTFGPSALLVDKAITIDGGTDRITISRNSSLQPNRLRLFYVTGTGNLALRNLTLSGGLARGGAAGGGGGAAGLGGAIVNAGALNLAGVTMTGNRAEGGSNNGTRGGAGGLGGDGVGTSGGPPNGGVGVQNGGFGGGGGFAAVGVGPTGGFGGGGGDGGSSGGRGGFGGGGGGGAFGPGGTGGFGAGNGGSSSSVNNYGGGGGGFGGAIFNYGGSVVAVNATLTGNFAVGGTGGAAGATNGSGFGGAIFNLNGSVTATNATVAGNIAAQGGGAIYSLGDNGIATQAGPVLPATTATVTLTNTILSGSNDGAGSPTLVSDYVQNTNDSGNGGGIGAVSSSGTNSIIQTRALAANDFAGTAATADPQLSALADNGGPTQTMALSSGSPAIDAGTDSVALTTDQRGFPRPYGVTDIGAFELQPTYSISGYVRTSSLAPVPGVSIQLSTVAGNFNAPVTTDASGFYTATNVPNGGYLVTPTLSGWSFSPTAQSVVVSSAPRGANFIATRAAATYSVSGRIANSNGSALPNVSVALTPAQGGVSNPVLTNSAGYYTFSGVPDGGYTITPTLSGYTFTPTSRSVTVAGANLSGQSFEGRSGFIVTGRISDGAGTALAGATVTIAGVGTATSNSAGYYTFYNVPAGSHTATPSLSGYTFSPPSREIEVNNADVSGQNFVGSTGHLIYGRIATSAGVGIADVSVLLSGRATPVLTNSAGYYTLRDVPDGEHTVTPSKSGYLFTPSDKTVTVTGADVGSQNFVGTVR